jgi:hypothetical protein
VYNVQPHEQHEAQLPLTLPQEGDVAATSGIVDHGDDGDEWQPPEEDDIDLKVLDTGGLRPLLFLTDDQDNGMSSYVEAVVLRFSGDGLERRGPSVKLEYASDVWLRHVDPDGAKDAEDVEEAEDSEEADDSEDAGAMDAEDNDDQAADAELPDREDAEAAAAAAVADGFWASTPPGNDDMDEDDDSGDGDSDSDESAGHCWYYAHSDRIVHLLSEWLEYMRRAHGLLGRIHVFSAPHERMSDWYRQLPGLVRPVASPSFGSSERPHKGPNPRTLREHTRRGAIICSAAGAAPDTICALKNKRLKNKRLKNKSGALGSAWHLSVHLPERTERRTYGTCTW